MRTDPNRFDVILDRMTAFEPKPDMPCMCRKHYHSPSAASVRPDWRKFYETDGWSTFAALDAMGLGLATSYLDINGADAKDPEFNNSIEGSTDGERVWLRPDPTFAIKTAAHELAHNALGHMSVEYKMEQCLRFAKVLRLPPCDASLDIVMTMSTQERETEAEATGLLVADALDYPDGPEADVFYWASDYCKHQMPMAFVNREKVKRAAQLILSAGMVSVRKAA